MGKPKFDRNSISEKQRAYRAEVRRQQEYCNHRFGGNGRHLENVHTTNQFVRDRNLYSDSTVICPECTDIFETDAYTLKDLNSGIFMYQSMLSQIKLFSELDENDWEAIDNAYRALDTISSMFTYYNDMVQKLTNGNKNNRNNNNGSSKGGVGVRSSMFGGKRY